MKPLPVESWDPALADIAAAMHGQPLEIHCLLANHPTLLRAWWNYRMHTVTGGDLEQRDCELVILRVAVHTEAWYEWAAHVVRGLDAGLLLAEIERVAAGPAADGWEERERLLLSAVDDLVAARSISTTTVSALSAYYSDRQVLDIISLQSVYLGIAGFIGTFPVALEARIAARLPDGVTEAAFRRLLSTTDGD